MSEETDSLLEFPCRFPIKAMGKNMNDFDALVVEIVRRHVGDLHESAVTSRPSSGGAYMAVTVVIEASSRSQLDNIYQELSANPAVLMAL